MFGLWGIGKREESWNWGLNYKQFLYYNLLNLLKPFKIKGANSFLLVLFLHHEYLAFEQAA